MYVKLAKISVEDLDLDPDIFGMIWILERAMAVRGANFSASIRI
jgi:hypothetical protein